MPAIAIGVAKAPRAGVGQSGDTVEVIERPRGGVSVVMVDGQGSGAAAKRLSLQLVNKAAALIGDGARDGAVVRAVHDTLYALRDGRVSATLTILSVDLEAGALLISQSGANPVVVLEGDNKRSTFEGTETPLGVHVRIRPKVTSLPIASPTVMISCTDGVIHAGRRFGQPAGFGADGIRGLIQTPRNGAGAQRLAETILDAALDADNGRAQDDMAVMVVSVLPTQERQWTRRLALEIPF